MSGEGEVSGYRSDSLILHRCDQNPSEFVLSKGKTVARCTLALALIDRFEGSFSLERFSVLQESFEHELWPKCLRLC